MSYENIFTTHGPIASFKHYDLQGDLWRIRIHESGVSPANTPTEYSLTGDMFSLTFEGDIIKEGRLEFSWLIENSTAYAAMTGLIGAGDDEYVVELQKNAARQWTGFLVADLIELTEGDYPRIGRLTAKDLISLNSEFVRDSDKAVANYDNLMQLFAEVLPFGNDIKTYTNWSNTNIASGDWLYNSFLDRTVFRTILPEDNEGNYTKREVLEQLAFAADVTMIQSEGDWHLMQRDNLENSTYTRYNYTATGVADSPASTSSVDLDQSVDSTNRWLLPASTAFWQGGVRRNLYEYFHSSRQYDFRFPKSVNIGTGGAAQSFERIFVSDGNQKLRFNFRMVAYATPPDAAPQPTDAFDRTATINIRIRAGSASTSYYYWDGEIWTTEDTTINDLEAQGFLSSEDGGAVFSFNKIINIVTDELPDAADGTLLIEFREASSTGLTFSQTYYDGIIFEIVSGTDSKDSDTLTFSLTNDGRHSIVQSYGKKIIGDGPNPYSRGSLRYTSSGLYPIFAGNWNRVGVTESKNFEEMILRSRMDQFRIPVKTIRAELWGGYSPHKIIAYDSKRFFFDRGVFVGKEGRWRSTYLIEINPQTATDEGQTDTLDTTAEGVIPDLPEGTSDGSGISASRIGFWDLVTSASSDEYDFTSDGTGAPTTKTATTFYANGDVIYNSLDGDTTPYRLVRFPQYEDLYDFRTSADGFVGTDATIDFGYQAPVVGENGDGRGLLEVTCTATGSGTTFIADSSPLYDGYMKAQVFIPSTNTTLLGVKARIGSFLSAAITTTDAWVDVDVSSAAGGFLRFHGTDSGGSITFNRTNGDIFLVRNVDVFGNVVDVSSGTVTNYNSQAIVGTYRPNVDILLVRNIGDQSIENWGYISTLSSNDIATVANTSAPSGSGLYLIYGVWRGAFTSIKGDYITTGTLDASQVTVTNLDAGNITTWSATVNGTLTIGSGGSITATNYTFNDSGGNIAGWLIGNDTLQSAAAGSRIELKKGDRRVVINDGSNDIVAMGYLDGLPKNDGSGNFPSGTYGFWAKNGDSLAIDGDVDYEDGDWIVKNNGAFKVINASAGEVIRLGYYNPGAGNDYGLWFFDGSGSELGFVTGAEIQIGDAGNDQYLSYTTGSGLVVKGSITATELITTNFSGTSAGVTIDDTGMTVNEELTIGAVGSGGKLKLVEVGGNEIIEMFSISLGAYNDIGYFRANDGWMVFRCDDGASGDYSEIEMIGSGNPIGLDPRIYFSPDVVIDNGGYANTQVLYVDGEMRIDPTVATSATAGSNGDVPAQVVGYMVININGTNRKIPYYAT